MNELENKEAKTFGYRLGQALCTVVVACLIVLAIGGTYAILNQWF